MITSVSSTVLRDFISVDVSQLSSSQIANFLEHLREKAEETEKNQQHQKKQLSEQIQRNANQRRDRLQQSLMQSISDIDLQQRREQLDTIDARKSLRKQELDQAANKATLKTALDKRLDQKHWDAQTQSQPQEIANHPQAVNQFAVVQQMQAQTNGFTESSLPKPLHLQSINSEIFRVPGSPISNANVNAVQQNPDVLYDSFQIAQNAATGNTLGNTSHSVSKTDVSTSQQLTLGAKTGQLETVNHQQDNAELGRNIQMLAAFSEHSGRLASVLMKSGQRSDNDSVGGKSDREARSLRCSLREANSLPKNTHSPQTTDSASGSSLFQWDGQATEETSTANNSNSSNGGGIPLHDLEIENNASTPLNPEENSEFLAKLAEKLEGALAQERPPNEGPYLAQQRSQLQKDSQPPMSTSDRVRLIQRVANACQSAVNRNGTIRMKLHPEELGSVSVKIRIQGKSAQIELESETEQAREVLLENADQLKERLLSQGMHVEAFSVSVMKS